MVHALFLVPVHMQPAILSIPTLDVSLCNLWPSFKFIRPAADTANDSQGLQDSDFQLCFSTYLFLSFARTFVAPTPSLSPRSFCPILTALFFMASSFLPSVHLCYIPWSPELWHIHLFCGVWQSGEKICVYLETASWNAELLKKWPGCRALQGHTQKETHTFAHFHEEKYLVFSQFLSNM